jgi:hypothetical protein
MVQIMEAWFHADKPALAAYYGVEFRTGALSQRIDIEGIAKADLYSGLKKATADCGGYSKGGDSFAILACIDPGKVRTASKWADRFLTSLDRVRASRQPSRPRSDPVIS